jgi:hypothetical protein
MALAIRTIEIYPTAENLSARPGPIVPHYAITLDAPHLPRRWVPGDASYADGYYVNGADLSIVRLDGEAYSYEIVSQVLPSGPNNSLITLPPGKAWFVDLRFQDTQWLLRRAGSMTP